ncbi:hypothetical protein MRB53_006114 [Persea americana]|uniref:Uncharacterized protein n=1 Tax=Persea americana TaxID=3435 RepID=A0ACC2MF11_PERAE|nr:hypothetical protein MRB53_006114 [Persea americana]
MLSGDSKHSRPLYYTGYTHDAKLSRIQINPGLAVNILLIQTMNHVSLTPKLLKETNVSIHRYDGHGSRALGKIKIKCQIGDMTAHPVCYVVEACTTYSLLLGRPWIHEKHVVPSTLHQCFKYTDSNLTVRRQFVDKKPIQGARVYCSDAALYEEEEQRLDTPLKQQETGVANGSRRDILQIIEKQFELINGVETSSLAAECDIET